MIILDHLSHLDKLEKCCPACLSSSTALAEGHLLYCIIFKYLYSAPQQP